ncbi:MAG: twin-arginine translocation signal domain-containing protein [Planctomycetes bacterium]|nr:twin-arginine translocation signal domain-containing protein [Planctomycetota bacterium]
MDITRRDFLKTVAAASFVPVVSGTSPASAWMVNRRNMWSPDRTSDEMLVRCDRLLAADPNNVLALVHRGQIPCIYIDPKLAWADLTKAISLEPVNPCCFYIRGVCFDNAQDLQNAISLLSMGGDVTGEAICSSSPDYYIWRGTEANELHYKSLRELGYAHQEHGRFHEAIATFKKAAQFEVISPENLETWANASFNVGSYCLAIVEYDRLIAIEPKAEFIRRRQECWAAIRRYQ